MVTLTEITQNEVMAFYQVNYRVSTKASVKGDRSKRYNAMIAALNSLSSNKPRHRDTSCWIIETSLSSSEIKSLVCEPLDSQFDHLAVVKVDINTRIAFNATNP